MKGEYDFSNAEQGKFYVPVEDIQIPIYPDKDVAQYLIQKCQTNPDTSKFWLTTCYARILLCPPRSFVISGYRNQEAGDGNRCAHPCMLDTGNPCRRYDGLI